MDAPKKIDKFYYPAKFACATCQSDSRIDLVAVSVRGDIVVVVECVPCKLKATFYLDYDSMLMSSQEKLLEYMLAPGQPKSPK